MTESLYLKYRPRTFKEVIGQAQVVRSLQNVLKARSNRTLLFAGPSGTGKTTLARIAAVEAGCTPESIQEINAAHFTGVDDMRQITSGLAYRPLGAAPSKAIILDECHMLSKAAWNSLLKPLEEPPAHVYWFLCTTDLEKVPQNIRTRCTLFNLKPVATKDIEELLLVIAGAENMPCSDGVVSLCARHAQGSPRAAIVSLGLCAEAENKAAALELLSRAEGASGAIDLARALKEGRSWPEIRDILEGLKDQNPESIRHVVRAYFTTIIMKESKLANAQSCFAVLEAFSKPFPSSDGISPLVLAIGGLLLGD